MFTLYFFFFFQAEDGIRDLTVTGVQTCALPIFGFLQEAGAAATPLFEENQLLSALVPALIAALVFAFSRTLWSFATVAEVYTLNTLLIVIIWFLMFRWRATGNQQLVYLASLIFGLGLGV